MILEAVGDTMGLAAGIIATATPPVAAIVLLFSRRGRVNSAAFMAGYVLTIVAIALLAMLIPGLETDGGEPSAGSGWIKAVLGAALLFLGAASWKGRNGSDDADAATPTWMAKIDAMGPGGAAVLGLVMLALNFKNVLLSAAAGTTIGSLPLSTGEAWIALTIFTVIAASPVIIPVVASLIAGDRIDAQLDRAKGWLLANAKVITAVILLVFGLSLLGDGLAVVAS